LTEPVEGKGAIVVAAKSTRGKLDGGGKVGEAGFGFALEEQARTFFQGPRSFGGHGEFLNGDDGVARRHVVGGRRLRAGQEGREYKDNWEKQGETCGLHRHRPAGGTPAGFYFAEERGERRKKSERIVIVDNGWGEVKISWPKGDSGTSRGRGPSTAILVMTPEQ